MEDTYGNHVTSGTGSTGTIAITGATTCAGGTVTAGVAGFTGCKLSTTAGNYTVTAKDSTHSGYTQATTTITVNPAAAAKLAFHTPPANIAAGTTIPTLVVWVEDTYGNHVTSGTGSTDKVAITGATCATSSVTAVAGVATFHTCTLSTTAGTYNVTAADSTAGNTGFTHASTTITVKPAAASKLVFHTPPANIAAGTTIPTLVVWVEDTYGNHVVTGTGATDKIAITGATCAASSVTAVAGVATFHTCHLSTATGTYNVTAADTSAGDTGLTHATATITVNPTTASKLAFHTPTASITAGTSIATLVVWVEDSYGNHVTSGTGSADKITVSGATCTAASVTAVAGVATFHTCHLSTAAGTYTVTAADTSAGDTGLTHATTTITVTPATASKLAFHTPTTAVTAGTTIPTLVVWVEDSYGNHVTSGTGSADKITVSGATCTAASVTAVAGVATFHTCHLSTAAGTYTVTAADTSPGDTGFTHATTTITVTPATASKLAWSSPPGTITAGSTIATLTVWVEDTYGNHVTAGSGSTDLIAITGTTCTAATVAAAAGVATFHTCTLSTTAGNYTVTAADASPGHTTYGHAVTTITVNAAAASMLAFHTPPGSITAGTTVPTLVVWVEDGYGNHVTTGSGSADTVAITGATCAASSVTAVAGAASFHTCTLPTAAGTHTVTAADTTSGHTGFGHATTTVTVNPAAAAQLAFHTPPSSITAGGTIPTLVVWVEDGYGNHVTSGTGSSDKVTVAGTTCAVPSVTAVAGVATFHTCTLSTTAGNYTVTASDATAGHTGYGHATTTITVKAAAASQLSFHAPPSSIAAGTTIPSLVVWVEDAYGNQVASGPGSTDKVAISGTTCAASSVTAVAGAATFHTCTLSTAAGSYTVTASDSTSGHTTFGHATTHITVNPAAASKLDFQTPPASITAGTTIPSLVVWVEDAYGNHVTTGAGSGDTIAVTGVSCSAPAVTAVGGVATFHTCTLPTTAGPYTVTAADTTPGDTGLTHATTTIIVNPAAAATLAFQAPPASITAGTTIPSLVVWVEDAYGNHVTTGAGSGDTIAVTGVSCSAPAVTAVGGVATFHTCTLPTATGTYTVVAADTTPGDTGLTHATTTVTVTPAAAARLVFQAPPASIFAGSTIPTLTVWVQDAYGNHVTSGPGSTDQVTVTGTNCATAIVAAAAGVATFHTCTLSTVAGPYTVTAADTTPGDTGLIHATTTITVNPSSPTALVFHAPPAGIAAGSTIPSLAVWVLDSYGNHVTSGFGSADTIAISGATCASSSVTAAGGVATFHACTLPTAVGTYTVTAADTTSGDTGLTHASATISVGTAAPATLVFHTPPASISAGSTIPDLVVWVEDAYGNHVTSGAGSADTVAISGTTCTAGSVPAVGGVATFQTCTLSTVAGPYTVTAADTSPGDTGLTHASATVTVNPSSPAALAFHTPPAAITSGSTIAALVVWTEDSYGNHVTSGFGSADTITISGATSASSSVTAAGGVATFHTCTLPTVAASYTVTAVDTTPGDTGLTPASTSITVTVGSASKLAFHTPPAAITAGTTIPTLVVWVEDAYGNHVTSGPGSTDTVAIAGVACAASSVAAVGGVATFHTCTLGTVAGPYAVTAADTSPGDTGFTPASTSITVTPSAAAALSFQAPPAAITAGTTIPTLVVWVEDAYGNHVTAGPGSTDSVAIAGVACATATVTAIGGVATFHSCTLSTTVGSYTVTATDTSPGDTGFTPASSAIAVNPAAAAALAFQAPPAAITAGTTIPTLVVWVEDAYGNHVTAGTGSADRVAITGTGCTTATVTASAGVATFHSCTLSTAAGAYTVVAVDVTPGHTGFTHAATSIAVNPAAASTLAFRTPPAAITAGATIPALVVWVEDPYGNHVTSGTGSADTIAVTGVACTATSVTAVNGVATFTTCTLPTVAGSYTVTATDTTAGHAGYGPATASITVDPAAAARLTFRTPPASSVAGTTIASLVVWIEDVYGNHVTSGTGSADTIAVTGITCSSGTATAVSGVAAFYSCHLPTTVGSYTVGASDTSPGDTGFTPASTVIAVTPAAATQLAFQSPPGSVAAGTVLATMVVGVEDTYGNLVTSGHGSTDTIALAGATCTASSTAALAGLATFATCTLPTAAGDHTVTASDTTAGDTGLTHATAVIAVTPAAPASLAFQSPPTTVAAGTTIASLEVWVMDGYGNHVVTGPGSTDTATITVATCSTASVAAVAGVAAFTACTLPTTAGTYRVEAADTTPGDTAVTPATATVAVTPAAASQLSFHSPPAGVLVGQTFTLTVWVEDPYGNLVSSGSGSTDLIAVSGVSLACTGGTFATAVGGAAGFSGCRLATPPTVTLTGTDMSPGHTGFTPASTTVTVAPAGTETALSATANPGTIGTPVVFTARVTVTPPGSGTPAGTVEFRDGATAITGCATQPLASGTATCSATYEVLGTYPISAVYSGSPQFLTSTSPTLHESFSGADLTLSQATTGPGGTTVYLPPVTLNGTPQLTSGALHTVMIRDNRGTRAGWTVTAQMEGNLERSTLSGNPLNSFIPASHLFWTPTVAPGSAPEVTAGPPGPLSTTTAAILCTAPSGYGQGSSSCNATLALTVPPTIYAGTYRAVVDIVIS